MFGLIDMEIDGIISGSMPTRTGVIRSASTGKPLKAGSPAYKRQLQARKDAIAAAAKARTKAATKKPKKKAAAKKQAPAKKAAAKKVAQKAPAKRPPKK